MALEGCEAEWTPVHGAAALQRQYAGRPKGGRVHPQRGRVPRDPLHFGSPRPATDSVA